MPWEHGNGTSRTSNAAPSANSSSNCLAPDARYQEMTAYPSRGSVCITFTCIAYSSGLKRARTRTVRSAGRNGLSRIDWFVGVWLSIWILLNIDQNLGFFVVFISSFSVLILKNVFSFPFSLSVSFDKNWGPYFKIVMQSGGNNWNLIFLMNLSYFFHNIWLVLEMLLLRRYSISKSHRREMSFMFLSIRVCLSRSW